MKFTPFLNMQVLGSSDAEYNDLHNKFYFLSIVAVPIFYTFIIYPFYKNESLYQLFAFENTIFNVIVVMTFLLFSKIRVKFHLKNKKILGKDSLYSIILFYTIICFFYLLMNLTSLGFGFYSGCHYCGPEPFLGWSTLRIIFFDLGVVLIMLSPLVYRYYSKKIFFSSLYVITVLGIISFFIVGSYRNQILPIVFTLFSILIYNWRYRRVGMLSMLCISPIAAIAYAYNL